MTTAAAPPAGATGEIRRFSAGLRAITAMLVTGILLSDGVGAEGSGHALTFVLLVYDLWAGLLLWSEARGRPLRWPVLHPWIDITWTGLLVQLGGERASLRT